MTRPWEFWIDVGGTFTDCLARTPDDRLLTCKVLSSGATKGECAARDGRDAFLDPARRADPPEFWIGYTVRLLDAQGAVRAECRVRDFDAALGRLVVDAPLPDDCGPGTKYELRSHEEAPLVAVRRLLGVRLDRPLPPVVVKLGTTRGTNALLTRTGARTAFVTTRGFADVLRIANQDRPRLFDLAIRKPEPVFERVVEIDERIAADGSVLRAPDEHDVRRAFRELRTTDVESLAICLLHSFANPEHERLVERLAREEGFAEISTSHRLAPLIKIVSRGDTTTMDAYLNPILRDYVGRLRASLGEGRLQVMTSAGGLVDADRFVGKDSVLSGPAGGVVGFSRTGQRAGFQKTIGFDMGGTSTDVARFDGACEMEFETRKAGVRVVAPMLAIETVAAGGGSICAFDGVKLVVGPASAGADPGPACYGRGGPLTVTDVNLYLGRLLPDQFPFPLDIAAVERRLQALCAEVAQVPDGPRYEPRALAEGFVRIADANMVRAVRRISVAKGYDPEDYVLASFGGAGGQHACAVARALGIRRILLHPYAGLLSAFGIGLADVRRFGERAVLRPHSPETLADLEPVFRELEERATDEVRAEGIPAERIQPPIRALDLRYKGVDAVIHVPRPDDGDYARRYAELHRQLYGYVHAERPLEIVAARVEVVGTVPDPPEPEQVPVARRPTSTLRQTTWFDGRAHDAAVFLRAELHAGDEIDGPAILCEPTSTVLVDPACTARILSRGEILIEVDARGAGDATSATPERTGRTARESAPTTADPVLLEIFNNLFASVAEQMGVTLQKTSCSVNVKERLDFSCAIFDPRGNLVVNAPHIPVHLGAMGETVRRVLADNPDLAPGDVYVTNDPYRGGSHLPDVTVVTPVHHPESRELLFFTASRAHHAEIGGIVPGSMPPFSRNLAEEGTLIRNFRLVRGGESRTEALRALLSSGPWPSRAVDDNLADVSAQVAANRMGVRLLEDLVDRNGLPLVQAYMGFIREAAARKMRAALTRIPDGTYAFEDHLDDGSPIRAAVTIRGDRATVDFAGTGPVLATNLNANRAIVTAAVLYVFRCLIDEDIPLNQGVLEPVELIVPRSLLDPPEQDDPAKSAAVVGGNVETSQRTVDVLLGALKLAAASQGTMNNLTFGDATFGYYETICGGSGATRESDGTDAVHTHMTNTRLTDVEVIERRYPVRIREFSIRRGSGGQGLHRGGDGLVRRIEFLRPLKVSMLSERRGPYPPFGLDGGAPGALGRNTLLRAGSTDPQDLGGKFAIDVQPGDVLTIETPGGGAWGRVEG